MASLDQPDLLPPQRHCFAPDRTSWVALEPGLPQHQGDTHTPLLVAPTREGVNREELYRRALSQIALQAFPDPRRVQMLAEILLPVYKYDRVQIHEALLEYIRLYPDGADYLLQPLDPKFDCPL